MGATVTARSGYFPDYARQQAQPSAERSPLGYYAAAARKGEPEGRWFGAALPELGLAEGEAVDMLELDPEAEGEASAFRAVYDQVNPANGEYLGRAPMNRGKGGAKSAAVEARLAELYAAEPHATAERRRELGIRAAREVRQSAPYTDVTVSWSKSISVMHASIRQNERLARESGDLAAAEYWADQERRFAGVLQDANRAMLRHAEEWAGTVRTGYHGAKVNGEETGRWEAAGLAVTSWLQGTSRQGDPHDHEHNLFARMAHTKSDAQWRALDTMALRRQLPAMQAVASAHAEAGLTREFGVEWTARADGAGNEIRGVTQEQMDLFSARAQEIDAELAQKVARFRADYAREPTRREVLEMHADAWDATRAPKEDGAIDWDALSRKWDAQTGGVLAQIAPGVMRAARENGAARGAEAQDADAQPARDADLARAARTGLARVQAEHATWTRADLFRQVGAAMPAWTREMDPDALVALVGETTDRALAGECGAAVVPLTSDAWLPTLPCDIRALDGRSVYTRPGSARYATRVQLSMEEELLRDAQHAGAPCMSREDAARAVGADPAALDAALRATAREARDAGAGTGSGLRLDQAAALYYVLTSPRTGEVLVGPAGSGKTRTLAESSRAWTEVGGDVIGLATSNAACKVLAAAGVPRTMNTAVFLGHTKERRGALGIRARLRPGTLILVDEASMMSTADQRDIMAYARRLGCKVIVCGDHAQLEAVESGGGLGLLASRAGHVQLAEAVRFAESWEGPASLDLRRGEGSAVAEYDDHGRVRGGTPEDMQAEARQMYVAHWAQGKDVRLITASRALGQEMARQIQSDLRHLGLVDADGPAARLAAGQEARRGDMIRVTKNDHEADAENRDILLVESVNEDGTVTVRRGAERDKETGLRCWSGETFRWDGYAEAELAYWSTAHSAQGETVTVGIPVVTGAENAHWLYSAMTRGAEANLAFVYTTPQPADPKPGGRADPELARAERVAAERAGEPAPEQPAHAEGAPEPRAAAAVLADIASRTDRELSALEYQQQEISDAHHLGRLAARWDGATRGLRRERYRSALRRYLPGEHRDALERDGGQATWLWRTMRAAEAAGLDVDDVARRALLGRGMEGADSIPAVIDARIRRDYGAMIPAGVRPWAEQVPEVADPELRGHLEELAAAMDARKAAIGEHAAEAAPGWATAGLGPVPEDPLARLDWEQRAAHIGAYREMYGWEHPADPVGMEPSGDAPEKRAAWHAAQAAITRTDAVDLSADPDSRLEWIRATYEAETAWAPEYPADRLRGLRAGAIDTAATAARSKAEAEAARARGEMALAERHESIERGSRELSDWYLARAEIDAAAVEDYRAWAKVTEGSRRLAVLADQELRHRYPDAGLAPLVSAEPEAPGAELPALPQSEDEMAALVAEAAARRAAFRERLEERQGVREPHEDPDYEPGPEAWPSPFGGRDPDAIIQPPKPEIRPAREVLERARQAGREAAG